MKKIQKRKIIVQRRKVRVRVKAMNIIKKTKMN